MSRCRPGRQEERRTGPAASSTSTLRPGRQNTASVRRTPSMVPGARIPRRRAPRTGGSARCSVGRAWLRVTKGHIRRCRAGRGQRGDSKPKTRRRTVKGRPSAPTTRSKVRGGPCAKSTRAPVSSSSSAAMLSPKRYSTSARVCSCTIRARSSRSTSMSSLSSRPLTPVARTAPYELATDPAPAPTATSEPMPGPSASRPCTTSSPPSTSPSHVRCRPHCRPAFPEH